MENETIEIGEQNYELLPSEVRSVLEYIKMYRVGEQGTSEKQVVKRMRGKLFSASEFPDYFKKFSPEETRLAGSIEKMRKRMKNFEYDVIKSYGSGPFKLDDANRAKPGKINTESLEHQMNIGSKPNKGILLKRIAEVYECRKILELGTNTGLSSCYFSASRFKPYITTIEGSSELSRIADHNIKQFTSNFKLMNMFFSDAFEALAKEKEQDFDLIFIDGQHEKTAMIHYMELFLPLMAEKSVFLFDDIFWSPGMNDGWVQVKAKNLFEYVIELDSIGLGYRNKGVQENKYFDVSSVIPRREVSKRV